MLKTLFLATASLTLASSFAQAAAPKPIVTEQSMMRHIRVLASDDFEGRKPGTAGETKTLDYIRGQLTQIGFEPAGVDGSWYQPVVVEERVADRYQSALLAPGEAILIGRAPEEKFDGPIVFVGQGLPSQLEGAQLSGAIAILVPSTPKTGDAPNVASRIQALRDAGATGVITVGPEKGWEQYREHNAVEEQLEGRPADRLSGVVSYAAVQRLLGDRQADLAAFAKAEDVPGFLPVTLADKGALTVTTTVNRIETKNLIGRLKGSGKTGESVLFLGHWDHTGICAPEGVADRLCNGAVDNASGIASMIELSRALASGKRPVRDILFLATTAEEMGLLGARYFAAHPTVPPKSIVAAINNDTIAIHGKGEPVAILGRGNAALDALIERTVKDMGRTLDIDKDHEIMVTRQDGYALNQAGIPTVMVGGSFANMPLLRSFLAGPYHKPNDDLNQTIVLDGAAEDTELMIELGRRLADPKIYQPSR